jgi:DNA-directed RNA polymerase subunit alpha
VLEDVTDIVLNVKSLAVRLDVDEPRAITVSASKAGPLTAAQIQSDPAVIIINQNLLLATLTANVDFSMEMVIEKGRGYVPANLEKRKEQNQIIGLIPIDAIFSPVRRVRYKTEETRVGQLINYDRLIMEIWTNGAITPELALVEAAKILRKHLGPFVQYFEIGKELAHAESAPAAAPAVPQVVDQEQEKKLNLTISELELSVRASNCLEGAKVETVRDLIQMSESQLLSLRSFGKTSLREVKRKLAELGLELRSVSSTSSIKKEL